MEVSQKRFHPYKTVRYIPLSENSETTKTTSTTKAFSPAVIAAIAVAALVVILSALLLFRSVFSGQVLSTLEAGAFRYELCGNGRLEKILVYKNGSKTATVMTNSVGSQRDSYGVSVSDVNFDGFPDLVIATDQDGDTRRYSVYLWSSATGTYRHSEAMKAIGAFTVSEDYQCIISHTEEYRFAGEEDGVSYYEDADVYRIYRTVNGETVEFARYERVYYTKNDIYVYSVFRFDKNRGVMYRFSEDQWMSEAEAKSFDLKAAMEADMAAHRAEYLPVEETPEES